MDVNEHNAALNAATTQLADVCRTCGEPATVTYPVLGGLDVGFCDAHDDNNGEGFYENGRWFQTRGERLARCPDAPFETMPNEPKI